MFHPRVYNPAPADFLSGANLALSKRVTEFKKRRPRFRIMLNLAYRSKTLDGKFQGSHEEGSIKEMQKS